MSLTTTGGRKLTKQDLVLAHLAKRDELSRVEALSLYNVNNLPQAIKSLRDKGHDIMTVTGTDMTGRPWTRYKLCQ